MSHGSASGRNRAPARIVATSPKVATASASHWPPPLRTEVARSTERQPEHGVGEQAAGDAAGDLGGDVAGRRPRRELPVQGEDEADRRIEMRARDRPERRDEDGEDRAGGDRVAEEREGGVVGERVGHDAGAHHRGDERPGAEGFGREAAREVEAHQASASASALPISRIRCSRASLSSDSIGSASKSEIRFESSR